MQQVNAYKCHSEQTLKRKIEELREQGHHAFSIASAIGDDNDWHDDPTYLLDPPIGYSTRPAKSVTPYLDQYNVIDVK